MNNILRIDSSTRQEGSFSRELGTFLESVILELNPKIQVVRRDLSTNPIEHIHNQTVAGYYTPDDQLTPELKAATALSDTLIAEIQQADTLLITLPMYNFSIPSALSAWLAQVVRIRKTFGYDGQNFTGLLNGKRVFVVVAYGASGYTNNQAFASANFVQPYLQFLLGFLGIVNVHFFSIEATTADSDTTAKHLEAAKNEIRRVFAIDLPQAA